MRAFLKTPGPGLAILSLLVLFVISPSRKAAPPSPGPSDGRDRRSDFRARTGSRGRNSRPGPNSNRGRTSREIDRESETSTNGPPGQGYARFQVIAERNIFNTTRSPRARRGAESERRAPQVDKFTVVGALTYQKGPYAFFDGTRSDYRKVLPVGGSIAGFKIAQITGDRVTLQRGTNHLELQVGMSMRREEEGEWQASGSPPALARSSTTKKPASGTSGNGDESDIVKRLMQQREQELK